MANRGGRRKHPLTGRTGPRCPIEGCWDYPVGDDGTFCSRHISMVASNMAHAERGMRVSSKYGITVEEYVVRFLSQQKCCAICRKRSDILVVDHDHETGAVRGLLCGPCNTGLGMFKDDPQRLQRAIRYLTS